MLQRSLHLIVSQGGHQHPAPGLDLAHQSRFVDLRASALVWPDVIDKAATGLGFGQQQRQRLLLRCGHVLVVQPF